MNASNIDVSSVRDDRDVTGKVLRNSAEANYVERFLRRNAIGISISESDDLIELGFSVTHLRDAMIEVARYLLNTGAILVYGGAVGIGGFTEDLYDLVRLYTGRPELSSPRLVNFLAWPLSLKLTNQLRASFVDKVAFRLVSLPESLNVDPSQFLEPVDTKGRLVWCSCLTKMRMEMNAFSAARIFVGGRASGFKGICPGVLEEIVLSLESKKPVYLVGAFGGVTKSCCLAIQGHKTKDFDLEHYYARDETYTDVVAEYNSKPYHRRIDYDDFYEIIRGFGVTQLSQTNGLSEADNLRLFESPHLPEIIHLILKGMKRTFDKN